MEIRYDSSSYDLRILWDPLGTESFAMTKLSTNRLQLSCAGANFRWFSLERRLVLTSHETAVRLIYGAHPSRLCQDLYIEAELRELDF